MCGDAKVLVFLKYPRPGQVKTRLAVEIGAERAAQLYRGFIDHVLGALQPIRPTVPLIGYFDGGRAPDFADWDALVDDWWPQPEGDLGERLAAAFARGFAASSKVLAIGTDCLEITADVVIDATTSLEAYDAVLGPSQDGGYYLIGLSRFDPRIFAEIRWSTPFAFADQRARCAAAGFSIATHLPELADIDTLAAWQSYRERQR